MIGVYITDFGSVSIAKEETGNAHPEISGIIGSINRAEETTGAICLRQIYDLPTLILMTSSIDQDFYLGSIKMNWVHRQIDHQSNFAGIQFNQGTYRIDPKAVHK